MNPVRNGVIYQGVSNGVNAKQRAIRLSIGVASLLALLKFGAGVLTRSLGILASGVDSLLDVFVSTINLFTLRKAEEPPDADHAYGHGKAESIAGLFQSLFIGVSGVVIIAESIRRLITRTHDVGRLNLGLGIMLFSMASSFFLIRRLKSVAAQNPSIVLDSEQLHFSSDLYANLGVIVTLFFIRLTGLNALDLFISLAIALYIFWQSMNLLRRSIDELMDREISPELHEKIKKIIFGHDPRIIDFHNLRTRRVGNKIFIDFHVVLRGEESFRKAHDLTESLISAISREIPDCDLTVHTDPEGGM